MQHTKVSRSPYAKHQKAPYQLSPQYRSWADAVEKHGLDSEEALAADVAFRRTFAVPQRKGAK